MTAEAATTPITMMMMDESDDDDGFYSDEDHNETADEEEDDGLDDDDEDVQVNFNDTSLDLLLDTSQDSVDALLDFQGMEKGGGGALDSKSKSNSQEQQQQQRTSVVKFAMDVHDNSEEQHERMSDQQQRSKVELLTTITNIRRLLQKAEEKYESERQRSKKKSKNLVKLAKELKKRSVQKQRDADRLEELEEKKKYLEHHWVLAQKELDQERVLRQKVVTETSRDLDRAIEEERSRYSKAIEEHEVRVAEMQRSHQAQCDELSQEILKATLEADRLGEELAAKGVYVPRRVMFNDCIDQALPKQDSTKSSLSMMKSSLLVACVAMTTLLGVSLWYSHNVGVFTKSGLCAPIMPGSELNHEQVGQQTFVAPWWTPTPYKTLAFNKFCTTKAATTVGTNDLSPPSLQWTATTPNHQHKLVLTVDGKTKLTKSALTKIEVIGSNTIRLWKRNGSAEEHPSVW